jgi:hypothetical protein
MNAWNVDQLRAETEEAAHEAEVLINCGEDLLDRAHEVAHAIEEQVHRVLNAMQDESSKSSDALTVSQRALPDFSSTPFSLRQNSCPAATEDT